MTASRPDGDDAGRGTGTAESSPTPETTGQIHHVVRAADWSPSATEYMPASLATEGFIHFSTAAQLDATVQRYYRDVHDLLVVTVAIDALAAELRWEDLAGTGVFPHLYGPLNVEAVRDVSPYRAVHPAPSS